MTNPTLPGTIQSAATGLKGFDTFGTVDANTATAAVAAGYTFCIRYLSLGSTQGLLSYNEALGILNAGLALSVVQQAQTPMEWIASAEMGTSLGTNAANNAKSIGLPGGMVVWCDLETPATEAGSQGVIDLCQAWYAAVKAGGYVPGLYVGAGCLLDGDQLYDLSFQHYWKSNSSSTPIVSTRGFQMVQYYNNPYLTINTVPIDVDTTNNDNKGGTVLWLKS